MATLTLSAVMHQEDDRFVAECPEVGTASQGRSVDEALANPREATELHLERQPLTPNPSRVRLATASDAAACRARVSWNGATDWLPKGKLRDRP